LPSSPVPFVRTGRRAVTPRNLGSEMLRRSWISAASAALIATSSTVVYGDKTKLIVSSQLGINYVPILMLKHDQLLEKHAKNLGLGSISVNFVKLGTGTASNDALLSGSVDLITTGTPTIIQLWSVSTGSGSAIKAIGALGSKLFLLNSTNPNVKTIRDFTEQDRIAVPAAKVGLQATLLQMECAKLFGEANFGKLDHLTVTMAHPDALLSLLSGFSGSITAHFGQSPFQDEELKNSKVHTVLTSHEVLGGPATSELLATTVAFHDANPVLCRAILDALEEAISSVNSDKKKAAQVYLAETQTKDSPGDIETIISPYSMVPTGIMKYADFLYKVGRIKRRPEKWSDVFFAEIHDQPGN